jgi:sulfur carrier protein
MNILVNGEKKVITGKPISLDELLASLRIENLAMVTVQKNGQFVDKELYSATILAENDEIDFVYFLGGGR